MVTVDGGILVQEEDTKLLDELKVVTEKTPIARIYRQSCIERIYLFDRQFEGKRLSHLFQHFFTRIIPTF